MVTRYNYTTNTLGNLQDVMTTDAFIVQFAKMPSVSGTSTDLSLRCSQVSLPGMNNQKVTVDIHGFQMHFRGKKTQGGGDCQLTFTEFRKGKVLQTLSGWHEFVVGTATGNSKGYKSIYSTTMTVTVFDVVGAAALQFKCFNVFPTQVPGVNLDSSNVTPMQLQATFSLDYYLQMKPIVLPL